jgi:TonB family protein
MRRWLTIALLAFSTAAPLVVPPAFAQQQQAPPESKRKLLIRPQTTYPALARNMNISGTVRVEAVVAPNGTVKSTSVLGGHPIFAQSALDAVRRCKWETAPHETKEIVILDFRPE